MADTCPNCGSGVTVIGGQMYTGPSRYLRQHTAAECLPLVVSQVALGREIVERLLADGEAVRKQRDGLSAMIDRRETEARTLIEHGASIEDLRSFVEHLIIDAADACTNFGPCVGCATRSEGGDSDG